MRLIKGFFVFIILLLLAAVGGYIYLRQSLPKMSGEVELKGISAPIEIIRDKNDVPHIFAKTKEDAYFALGYVHAQDRLWQMEFQRRVGAGRLSEFAGEKTLDKDKFLRTISVYHYAKEALKHLSSDSINALDAYVNGVNSYLNNRKGPLPPEFLFFKIKPEPWTKADVLVWAKMMAWDLGANWSSEILRARLATRFTVEQLQELSPPYPNDAPVALPDMQALYKETNITDLTAGLYSSKPPGLGSNNWVLGGQKTVTGMPLLANDPHLALMAPALWYFAHLNAPGLNVIGGSLPGTPAVLLGRNDNIAWGFTNTGPDVQDMFIEKINPDNPNQYLTPDGYKDFESREEIIKVKGKADVTITVRSSRHGPIISDVSSGAKAVAEMQGEDYVLAFAWTALKEDDSSVQALLKLDRASNWQEFVEALKDFKVPEQNIVYADIEGNIGYYAPADVPIRKTGNGRMPVPGWTGEYDWIGYIPFEDLPHEYNPSDAQIVTANHKIVPDSYPYFITAGWTYPYRAERIEELLAKVKKHSLESFARIQSDQKSLLAVDFLPYLLALTPQSDLEQKAHSEMLAWDAVMDKDSPAPMIFAAWYSELNKLVYEDELGSYADDFFGFRPNFMNHVFKSETKTNWCDDISSPEIESCEQISARAFTKAIANLSKELGDDIAKWNWGKLHYAKSAHSVFTGTPLARFFDINIPNGGGTFTVDVASYYNSGDAYHQYWGPSFRALYDLSDLNNSRFIHSSGQSGNPLSKHYKDFAKTWRDVDYISMTTDRAEIEKGKIGILTLSPAQ